MTHGAMMRSRPCPHACCCAAARPHRRPTRTPRAARPSTAAAVAWPATTTRAERLRRTARTGSSTSAAGWSRRRSSTPTCTSRRPASPPPASTSPAPPSLHRRAGRGWPAHAAPAPTRCCSASAGTRPPGPSSGRSRRQELDRAAGGRPVLLGRVDVHSGRGVDRVARRLPARSRTPSGYDASGLVARDAHHAARAAALFRAGAGRDREGAHPARAAGRRARRASAWCTSSAAPHISPADDFAVIAALAAGGRCPRSSATGVSSTSSEAVDLGCAGAAGDLCMDGAIGSRTSALHAPYADADTTGHLYLDRRAGRRARRRLHRAPACRPAST